MHKEVSFYLMIAGMILTAIGAANPVHGTCFELAGIASIWAPQMVAKRSW